MAVLGNQVAMITPMDDSYGVDYASAESLASYLVRQGADGILVTGTTGESSTLTSPERMKVAETVVRSVGRTFPVGVNVSHSVLAEAVTLARHAERANAAYILIGAPSTGSHGSDLVDHILSVATSVTLPVMVYDGADGVAIPLAAYDALLAAAPNICHSKVNVAEAAKIAVLRDRYPDRLTCFIGKDDQTMLGLRYGARGFVCATSNLVPGRMSRVCASFLSGSPENARALYYADVAPLVVALFASRHLFIQLIKVGLQSLGVIKNAAVRPNLAAADEIHVTEFRRAMYLAGVRPETPSVAS